MRHYADYAEYLGGVGVAVLDVVRDEFPDGDFVELDIRGLVDGFMAEYPYPVEPADVFHVSETLEEVLRDAFNDPSAFGTELGELAAECVARDCVARAEGLIREWTMHG